MKNGPRSAPAPRRAEEPPATAFTEILYEVADRIATITLNRPEKKNPLTFDSYAEASAIFRAAARDDAVRAFVVTGAGGDFCSGGDVHEIIGPLTKMDSDGLLRFTRMTGDLVRAMRACPPLR